MPDILGTAEIKYAINGLLSLTPDGFPVDRRDPWRDESLVVLRQSGSRKVRARRGCWRNG